MLAICNELGVGVVPQGGNTSYCGGATPGACGDEIVLSLAPHESRPRPRRWQISPSAVEAGCMLADVQAAAAAADRFFPLSLGSEGSCQIGGNLSTNAGGLNALHYGVARDLVLGLEVVLADGRVLDGLTSLRKDNTGYDLRDLFIGAEGTLGVITAASLKLFPAAAQRRDGIRRRAGRRRRPCNCSRGCAPRPATSCRASSSCRGSRVEFTARHVPGVIDPLERPYDAYVLCELSSSREDAGLRQSLEPTLERALHDGLVHRRGARRVRSRSATRSGGCASPCPRRSAQRAPASSTTSRCPVASLPAVHGAGVGGRRSPSFRPGAWSPTATSATATCIST